ncbi:MAG: PmoA family protein [Phycisphaerae bacterium]
MNTPSAFHTLALFALLAAIPSAARAADTPAASPVEIKDANGQLQISIANHPFTTYRYTPKPDDPKWNRPYFFPVLADDGTPVTSDQWRLSQTKKADHPWHRSLYVAWGDINGVDHWRLKENQQRHLAFKSLSNDSFVESLAWDGQHADAAHPVLTEIRTVHILTYPDGSRAIDIQSEFTAPDADAVFKCLPLNVQGVEAGLCSVRVAAEISTDKHHVILSASGARGEKAARAEPAAWCDYSGAIHDKPYGIALVASPLNLGGEQPWHVRDFGLFANTGPLNFTLKQGHSMVFRDLVLIHAGDALAANVKQKAESWRASISPPAP